MNGYLCNAYIKSACIHDPIKVSTEVFMVTELKGLLCEKTMDQMQA